MVGALMRSYAATASRTLSNVTIDLTAKPATKTVSVLMPAALATQTIRTAVESILDCDLARAGKVEIIVSPDDGFHGYAEALSGLPHCVVLDPTKFYGPGMSRNRAFAASSGEWITMVDADDVVTPGYLDDLLRATNGTHLCAFARMRYECDGELVRQLEISGDTINTKQFAAFGGSIHALIHRSIKEPYPTQGIGEDVLVDAAALHACGGVAPLADAAYVASLHSDSMCATVPQLRVNEDYREVLANDRRSTIVDIFAAKLAFGILYEQHCLLGGNMDFHKFMAAMHAAGESKPAPSKVAAFAVG